MQIEQYQQRIDKVLRKLLPENDAYLIDAMHYAVLNGGKRIRAALVYATATALNVNDNVADHIAAAIECIHAYSLVHDDLPAMDDDDLRRGAPTCHIAYDEATAILVGDSLQSLAFELLSKPFQISPEKQLTLIHQLTQSIGAHGMAGGQALDVDAVGQVISFDEMETIHRKKTAELISASVMLPAYASDCDKTQLHLLKQFSLLLGLAFQVQDDVLDVISTTEQLGKKQGADENLSKPLYRKITDKFILEITRCWMHSANDIDTTTFTVKKNPQASSQ